MADAEYWYSCTYQGIPRSTEPRWRVIPAPSPATQEQFDASWYQAAQTITFPTIAANQMYWLSPNPGQSIKFSPPEPVYDPFTDPLMRLPEGM